MFQTVKQSNMCHTVWPFLSLGFRESLFSLTPASSKRGLEMSALLQQLSSSLGVEEVPCQNAEHACVLNTVLCTFDVMPTYTCIISLSRLRNVFGGCLRSDALCG